MNAFSLPVFSVFFVANSLSSSGKWVQHLALGWLAWQISGSVFWTSFVVLGMVWPTGLLSPFIAVYAENWNTRRAMMLAKSLMILNSVIILGLQIWDAHTLASLAILAIFEGVLSALHQPTRLVFVSILVPRAYLPNAIALNAVSWNMSRVVGPALGGLMIANFGIVWAFAIMVGMLLPLVCIVPFLPLQARNTQNAQQHKFSQKMGAGIIRVWQSPVVLAALGMVVCNSLLVRAVIDVQPALVGAVFGGDSKALAIVASATGLGSVIGSALIGLMHLRPEDFARLIRPSLVVGVLSTLALSQFATLLPISLVYVLCGLCATTLGVSAQTLIQLDVSDEFRARVMTWWSSIAFNCTALGGFFIGIVGDILPISHAILLLLAIVVVMSLWFAYKSRTVFRKIIAKAN